MNELKEKLSALGISDEQVDQAIEAFTDFLKDKVPNGMEGMLESVLHGKAPDLGENPLDQIKGYFGS